MRAFFKNAALAFFTSSIIFLWVPLYLAYLSRDDLDFNLLDSLIVYITITLVMGVVLFAITKLFELIRLPIIASGALYLLLFWGAISGFMLPLVEEGGMVAPENLITNQKNLLIVGGLAAVLTLLAFTKLRTATFVFVLILAVTSVGTTVPELFKSVPTAERFSVISDTDNVIVLSLDGISGFVAKKVLDENPDLELSFKDFTFYENAVSVAPATKASIRAELYGNINFRALAPNSVGLSEKLVNTPNSIQREQAAGTDIMTYGAYGIFNTESKDKIISHEIINDRFQNKTSDIIDFYRHIGARIGTAHTAKLISDEIRTFLPAQFISRKFERSLVHQGASWDSDNTFNSDVLVALTDKLQVASKPRSVRYMHFLHTHFPVDLDQDCSYRSADKAWFDNHQNYQGLYGETLCGFKQTAKFLDKLKALGVYDKTLILVKSDHGAPVNYFHTSPESYTINNHDQWGYDRYRPLLMIKNYATHKDDLTDAGGLVSLGDIAKTLCLHSPDKEGCEAFKGLDLLDPKVPDTSPHLYLDVVKDASSGYNFSSQITAEVSRENDFPRALVNSGKVVLGHTLQELYSQRKANLDAIKVALEKYYLANGAYPVSQGFDGLYTEWGRSAQDWIKGLAPAFIASLPRDPEFSDKSTPQYLYQSNGVDYKLIAHGDLSGAVTAQTKDPDMSDPKRASFAFGFWSAGAKDW
jgi:hypothetical protein